MTARPILKISLCRPRGATILRFRRVPTSCSAVSLRTIGAIGTPRPGDNTFLYSWGRWKSGSAMAPRAVLDRVMWSSLTTSQARATRRARWEFRGSVPLCRWPPNAGPARDAEDGSVTQEETAHARASTYDDPTEDLVSTARIICPGGRDQSHWREDGGSAGL